MNPIRVLNIVTKMDAAGIETLLMNFYRNIDRSRVQFDFLTHRNEKGFYDDEILRLGGRIYHVPPINPLRHSEYRSALESFFNEHKEYQIVHSHINTYSMYPLRAAMHAGIPVRIAHSHTANVPLDIKTPFRIYTKSRLKKYSTHNFACSEIAGKWLFGKEAIQEENFWVVNNSIDAAKYTYDCIVEERVKEELEVKDKLVIGHVGRFTKEKNHSFIIDIFSEVHKQLPNSALVLVGEGELFNAIKDKVNKLNLQEHVIFTGVRSDVNELFQAFDVFLFPSLFEGLGIVAVEAQAAGVNCFVSDRVPEEALVTDLITRISLSQSSTYWATMIINNRKNNKTNKLIEIKQAGFDIKEEAKKLQRFYETSTY